MPAKRKAPSTEDTPSKRHTRSNGQVDLDMTNLPNPNSITPRHRAPVHSPTHPRPEPSVKGPKTKPHKATAQSHASETIADSESDDELILSPSRHVVTLLRSDLALSTSTPHRNNKPGGYFSSENGTLVSYENKLLGTDNAHPVSPSKSRKKTAPPRRRLDKNFVSKSSTCLKSSPSGATVQSASRVFRQDIEEKSSSPPPLSHPLHNTRTVPMQIRSYHDSISQNKKSKHVSLDTATGFESVPAPSTGLTQKYIPQHLPQCLNAQKRAMLQALQVPPKYIDLSELSINGSDNTNDIATQQLNDLLNGSIIRGEGNSCLILGPRGSGKTQVSSPFPFFLRYT